MNQDTNDHTEAPVQPQGQAAMLRAAADGELTPEQEQALCDQDASARARIDTERALRQAVSKTMGQVRAPASLRAKIERAMQGQSPLSFEQAEQRAPRGWQRPWWLGVAAGFALAAALVYFVSPLAAPNATPGAGQFASRGQFSTVGLVDFLEDQHDSCANLGPFFQTKMPFQQRADAERAAIEMLDMVPDVLDLADGKLADLGYDFAGLGACRIPGKGKSAHLLYTSSIDGQPPISLWVQQDTGEWNDRIKEIGCTYGVDLCEERGTSLSIWREKGLLYFLYTPSRDLQSPARVAFRAPTISDTI